MNEKALVEYQPVVAGGLAVITPAEVSAFDTIAARLFRARVYPQYESPDQIFAACLILRDLGVSVIVGLECGFPIPNRDPSKPSKLGFEVKVKLAALQARVAGFEHEIIELTPKICRMRARLHPDAPWSEAQFTIEQAQRAGLVKPGSAWVTFPEDHLFWKTMSRWMRRHAMHVLMGAAIPKLVFEDDDAVPEERERSGAEVLPDEGREQPGGPDAPTDPEPAPNHRELFIALAEKIGMKSGKAKLSLVNALNKESGHAAVNSTSLLDAADFKRLYAELAERYDPVTGQKRQDGDRGPSGEAPAPPSTAPAGPEPPAPASPAPSAPPVEGVEPEKSEPEQRMEWMLSGDPQGLLDLANEARHRFNTKGFQRTFAREFPSGSGDVWIVDQDTLKDCAVKSPVLIVAGQAHSAAHVGTLPMRLMLAKSIQRAVAELEAK